MKKYIKDYSIFPTAFFVFTDFDVFKSFFKYIRTVIKDFFFLQFIRKMGLSKIPIAKVDNVLDDKIPFDPNKIKTYLDFTNFWIKPLTMLIKELGRKGSKKYVIEFFKIKSSVMLRRSFLHLLPPFVFSSFFRFKIL